MPCCVAMLVCNTCIASLVSTSDQQQFSKDPAVHWRWSANVSAVSEQWDVTDSV